jgi:hypothetical protein
MHRFCFENLIFKEKKMIKNNYFLVFFLIVARIYFLQRHVVFILKKLILSIRLIEFIFFPPLLGYTFFFFSSHEVRLSKNITKRPIKSLHLNTKFLFIKFKMNAIEANLFIILFCFMLSLTLFVNYYKLFVLYYSIILYLILCS